MVEHLPKLKRVDLTGIGESLMNRDFFRIVEFLKSRGMYVTLNDNFTLMTEAAARRLIELEIDQIFLSLDGATKQTYEPIRVGANFDKVMVQHPPSRPNQAGDAASTAGSQDQYGCLLDELP